MFRARRIEVVAICNYHCLDLKKDDVDSQYHIRLVCILLSLFHVVVRESAVSIDKENRV